MKSTKNPFLNLLSYSWRYSPNKSSYITFVSLGIIANAIDLFDAILIGRVFNSVQFSANDPRLLSYIINNLLLLVLVTLGYRSFLGISRVIETRNAFLIRKNYKLEMFNRVMDLPVQWQKDNHSGDTISKINKAAEALYGFSEEMFITIANFVALIGSLIILAFFSWKIAVLAFFISMLAVWTSLKFDSILAKGYEKVYKAENHLASAVHDYISNIITVISLRLKKRVSREIENRSMSAFAVYQKNNVINELKWSSIGLYISITTAAVLIFNAHTSYKTTGVIILSTLFILYSYLYKIGNFFYNFAWIYNIMVQRNTAVELADTIRVEHEQMILKKKTHFLPKNWHCLQLKNLTFSYRKKNDEDYVGENLDNVSITIERNKKIALIGESGSGKSTIMSLIRGLHETNKINIYSDGKKLSHGLKHLYEHTALIPQEPEIFNSSVRDNITMGVEAENSEIENVMKISRFSPVLKRLKRGLETNVLEKGVSLSGGEKQRLALARGLLMAKEYDFLLLDEPTSSVDSDNESKIYQNIFKHYKDKTIISSIHRLHLLRNFDYIYYFENGKIISEGNFNTLLNDEKFKGLWDNYSKREEK